jgi:hypothetical protein
VLEVHPDHAALATSLFAQAGVPCAIIGKTLQQQRVDITVAGQPGVSGNTAALRCVCVRQRQRPRLCCGPVPRARACVCAHMCLCLKLRLATT